MSRANVKGKVSKDSGEEGICKGRGMEEIVKVTESVWEREKVVERFVLINPFAPFHQCSSLLRGPRVSLLLLFFEWPRYIICDITLKPRHISLRCVRMFGWYTRIKTIFFPPRTGDSWVLIYGNPASLMYLRWFGEMPSSSLSLFC